MSALPAKLEQEAEKVDQALTIMMKSAGNAPPREYPGRR
jgi:hypothetical protein